MKLTALPDNTTKSLPETEWGTEIVMRPPTICFLACSICANYITIEEKEHLRSLLRKVPQINHWEEIDEVLVYYNQILSSILAVSTDMCEKQKPLIIQPIWKTEGNKMRLKEDCLDVTYDMFDYKRIIRLQSYNLANDKAFALPGTKSHAFLKGDELVKPRISKYEIKNIILGGGQDLLSPERRFDAVLVNSPDIFE